MLSQVSVCFDYQHTLQVAIPQPARPTSALIQFLYIPPPDKAPLLFDTMFSDLSLTLRTKLLQYRTEYLRPILFTFEYTNPTQIVIEYALSQFIVAMKVHIKQIQTRLIDLLRGIEINDKDKHKLRDALQNSEQWYPLDDLKPLKFDLNHPDHSCVTAYYNSDQTVAKIVSESESRAAVVGAYHWTDLGPGVTIQVIVMQVSFTHIQTYLYILYDIYYSKLLYILLYTYSYLYLLLIHYSV